MKKTFALLVSILILTVLVAEGNNVLIVNELHSPYVKTIQELYPEIELRGSLHTSAFQQFYNGKNVEAYKSQVVALVNNHLHYYFEPHYTNTVIIAVDRDQTNETLTHFKDIFSSESEINFNFGEENGSKLWDLPSAQHIVLSMSLALYGDYAVQAIAEDFYTLNKEKRFFANDESKPISVMYDTEAVQLLKKGRNIEIIIPQDGTLSFDGGIFSKNTMGFKNDAFNNLLVENGMRLVNGVAHPYFPNSKAYEKAHKIEDFNEFNKVSNTVGFTLRRNAFETERYGFTDHKARAVFFLCFLIVIVFYIISINRRLTNINIRHSIVGVCTFQIILVSMGCLKALNFDNPIVETILWYGYYYAFVYITAIYLYMALISGKNREAKSMPFLYKLYLVFSTLLVLMVSTNNFHGFVFTVYDYRDSTFDYNTGYFIVMGWIYLTTCSALGILMYKVIKMPRKNALILPFIMNLFTITFMIGYARRIPLFYDFDFAYSINIIILLYIEACIQSKLLASNTHYRKMFANSHLRMEIQDKNGETVERSLVSIDHDMDYVLRKTNLLCGSFLYYEDYTELNTAREKLKVTNTLLEKNNMLLKKQSEITAERASLAAEKSVYESIDSVLHQEITKVDLLLAEMKNASNTQNLVGRINIITCAIKRKCIFRINTLYKEKQTVENFLNCIGEMRDFAKNIPLTITVGCRYFASLSLSQVMAMYELFCIVIETAAVQKCSDILVQIYEEDSKLFFSIIPDKEIHIEDLQTMHFGDLSQFQENLSVKPWDDSSAILLSFEKENSVA